MATSGVGNSRTQLIAATRGHDTLIGFDIDHRLNPSVCGQLAALIAERARDSQAYRTTTARTEIIIWEGAAKGIDDTALAGIRLSTINAAGWFRMLEGDSLERVKEMWNYLEFNP
jgi:hypothetical protein